MVSYKVYYHLTILIQVQLLRRIQRSQTTSTTQRTACLRSRTRRGFSWLHFTTGMIIVSSLPVVRKARTPISSSNASQRKASQVVSHHTQPQVGKKTPSSGMALARMSSKPCLLYRKRQEASGTASLTMCRQPTTRKWLRTERPRRESSSTHQNSETYLDLCVAVYEVQHVSALCVAF